MPKRNATSELNHTNWNDEDVPEDAGTFQKATPDVIEKRVIKSARRHGVLNNSGPGVFSGFQGFSKVSGSASPFSFLKKPETQSGGETESSLVKEPTTTKMSEVSVPVTTAASSSHPAPAQADPLEPSPPYTDAYLAAVKKLNECFVKHIQTYYQENEFVIFSPCFRDYEKHLKEILNCNNPDTGGAQDKLNSSTLDKVTPNSFGSQPQNASSTGKFNVFSNAFSKLNSGPELKVSREESDSTFSVSNSPLSAGGKTQFPWFGKIGEQSSNPLLSNSLNKEEVKEPVTASDDPDDEGDEPVKVEVKTVVEEGSIYSRRCKVFIKKDNSYQDHGVGMLYLKPVETGKKTQLIVRADTSLGNVLINTLLNSDMSIQKMGKNNVMLCCVPTPDYKPPKPLPVLLRVKTSEDADELLKKMNELTKD